MAKIPKKRNEAEHGRRLAKKRGKQITAARASFDRMKHHTLDEALELLAKPENNYAKFNQTVEVCMRLGVDPRKSDQMVRGAVVLPHGTGKTVRVLVFAKGEKVKEAENAGADFVGGEELVQKIQKEGWLDFDKVIATPDMMRHVGRIGKILGPRGLMPTPKVGTVTLDVAQAVNEQKSGKIAFRVDKASIIHAPIGRADFGADKLRDNILSLVSTVQRLKPQTSKGVYMRKVSLSLTQGPGVKLEVGNLQTIIKNQ
jgi:large subunit ribosomal protein L1